jgi:hypothetical protein
LLEFLVNKINNIFHKKKAVILYGKNALLLNFYKNNELVNNFIFKLDQPDNLSQLFQEIKKYKDYHFVLLLDGDNIYLRYENFPSITAFFSVSPIQKYISKNYSPTDLVAYDTELVVSDISEIWHTSIANTSLIDTREEIIDHLLENKFRYSGSYFLSLELNVIIPHINNFFSIENASNHFLFFIYVTGCSDVKIALKHDNRLIEYKEIKIERKDSDLFLLGKIEQKISDLKIKYQVYIDNLGLIPSVTIISGKEFSEIIKGNHKLNKHSEIVNIFSIPRKEEENNAENSESIDKSNLPENFLIKVFSNHNSFLALNKKLKKLTFWSVINSIIFKPIIALSIFMLIVTSFFTYEVQNIESQIARQELNYKINYDEYQKIKEFDLKLCELIEKSNLHKLDHAMNSNSDRIFDIVGELLNVKSQNIKINSVEFQNNKQNILYFYQKRQMINIYSRYFNESEDRKEIQDACKLFAEKIKQVLLTKYDIKSKITYKLFTSDALYLEHKYEVSVNFFVDL